MLFYQSDLLESHLLTMIHRWWNGSVRFWGVKLNKKVAEYLKYTVTAYGLFMAVQSAWSLTWVCQWQYIYFL